MLFEIINPSDPYTMRADDPKVAMAAVLIVGNGKYGLRDEDGGEGYDVMLAFAPEDRVEGALVELFGESSLKGFIDANVNAIADCLDSVMSFGLSERNTYEVALEAIESGDKRAEFRAKIHDKNRSSLNDIGGRAWEHAKQMRKQVEETNECPNASP